MEKYTEGSEHGAVRYIDPKTGKYQEAPAVMPRRIVVRHFMNGRHNLDKFPRLKKYREYYEINGTREWDEITINEIYGLIKEARNSNRWN